MSGRSSQGVKIEYNSGGFTKVVQLRRLTPPEKTAETADTTHLESVENWRECINTLKDGGEGSFELVYDGAAATHKQMETYFDDQTLVSWKITVPDGSTGAVWTFSAFVTKVGHEFATGAEQTCSVTIKVSGPITFPS